MKPLDQSGTVGVLVLSACAAILLVCIYPCAALGPGWSDSYRLTNSTLMEGAHNVMLDQQGRIWVTYREGEGRNWIKCAIGDGETWTFHDTPIHCDGRPEIFQHSSGRIFIFYGCQFGPGYYRGIYTVVIEVSEGYACDEAERELSVKQFDVAREDFGLTD